MELRPGYKQTDVGVIPVDWEVRSLGEVCLKITDGTHDTPKTVQNGIPFLTAIHVRDNFIDYEACAYVTLEDHRVIYARCNPQRGDLLMVNIGAGVGTSALVDVDFEFSLKNVAMLKPNPNRAFGNYLNQSLIRLKKSVTQMLLSGGAQPFLSLAQIGQILVPVPPLPEQKAIAQALSDIDALICGLDDLIAKKRDIKQATMQQLLTGKTRLPGFTGDWEVKRIGDVADIDPDNLSSETRADYRFNYISLEDVDHGRLRSHTSLTFGLAPSRARRIIQDQDILVSTVRPNLQSHLLFHGLTRSWVCSTGFCVLRCFKEIADSGYIYAHLFGRHITRQVDALLTGSNYPAINSKDVRTLQVPIPPLPEQQAIATVLSDIDDELAALEQRREKTCELKQAMMQELLTGRTRLV